MQMGAKHVATKHVEWTSCNKTNVARWMQPEKYCNKWTGCVAMVDCNTNVYIVALGIAIPH